MGAGVCINLALHSSSNTTSTPSTRTRGAARPQSVFLLMAEVQTSARRAFYGNKEYRWRHLAGLLNFAHAVWTARLSVKRIASGDESALATLYDTTCGLVYGLLLRILGNSETAEQVLVAVYQDVWKQAATYGDEREKPLTWLITLVRRAWFRRANGHRAIRRNL